MFYFPWSFTDAAIRSHGISYNGKDKNGSYVWDKINTIYVWELETAATPVQMMGYWNHMISVWLNNYVTQRIIVKGQKAGPMIQAKTFMISAFWHGFYPSYYILFIGCAFLLELAKDIYRIRIFFEFIPAPLGHIICTLLSHLALNYLGCLLSALTFEKGFIFAQATSYSGFILLPGLCLFIKFSGLVGKARKMQAKKDAKVLGETKKDK